MEKRYLEAVMREQFLLQKWNPCWNLYFPLLYLLKLILISQCFSRVQLSFFKSTPCIIFRATLLLLPLHIVSLSLLLSLSFFYPCWVVGWVNICAPELKGLRFATINNFWRKFHIVFSKNEVSCHIKLTQAFGAFRKWSFFPWSHLMFFSYLNFCKRVHLCHIIMR